MTARTLNPGSFAGGQGESSFPGLVEEQSEAYRDGSLIAWGEEEEYWGSGTLGVRLYESLGGRIMSLAHAEDERP